MKTGGPGIRVPNWDYSPKQLSLYSGSQILIQFRPTKEEKINDTTVNVAEWQIQKESQIHILIVDWKDDKASRALNMKVTFDRDDDYDTVSTAVAKEVEKYRQQEEIKEREMRSKARLARKQLREKKLKERQDKNEIPDQQVLEKEEDEKEKDYEEEKNDNSSPLPTVSKQFILLTREKANGNLVDINPDSHMTAEMMTYPEAYQRLDVSELTGEEKNGGGYKYLNLIQYDKLKPDLQKQLYFEVLAVEVPTYFANSFLLDFKARDTVQRPLYQERHFIYKKDGNVADILRATLEMFIKKPPLQNPRNEVNISIYRPKFPETAKQRTLLVHLEGSKIISNKSRKVRVDFATRDPFIRCTNEALLGGEEYEKIFSQEMEQQKIEIAKEPQIRVPVFFVDPAQLKRGIHNNGDKPFDVVMQILCTRGSIMTIEEAMKLNIWIEDSNETIPICDIKQDPGLLFKLCTMILIGKKKLIETKIVITDLSTAGGREIQDNGIILKYLEQIRYVSQLYLEKNENMILNQYNWVRFNEEIEEEGGIEEIEAQLVNITGDVKTSSLTTQKNLLNSYNP
ncbi:MAG: hypothetical protein EZS28_008247 [Streblomastix strix]|uniref:Uncharacterized protein n=1 Tax=Streblomastix strix TaxID=222440 RepID=A0A5J4WMK9_9EUKA|nr:MAG: hypothetical protein EZS28_008247 [Streblomastix strix]